MFLLGPATWILLGIYRLADRIDARLWPPRRSEVFDESAQSLEDSSQVSRTDGSEEGRS